MCVFFVSAENRFHDFNCTPPTFASLAATSLSTANSEMRLNPTWYCQSATISGTSSLV